MVFGKIFGKIKSSFDKTVAGLEKTRASLGRKLGRLFTIGRKIDNDFLAELEETLILSDIGVSTTEQLIEDLKEKYRDKTIDNPDEILDFLKKDLRQLLGNEQRGLNVAQSGPTVILVVGVNGAGKTTSIAKLARLLKKQGRSVMLAAGDTFRAAAADQLTIWSERVGADIVHHASGADPGAVVYDAVDAALNRNADVLIVDTAGRLHTQTNLMRELEKIVRVIQKKIPDAPHEVLLVLDATTGQNAINQARLFGQACPLTGIFLAKLDGTARGGIVIAIKKQVDVPVKFIGTGEKFDDVSTFDSETFIEALFTR